MPVPDPPAPPLGVVDQLLATLLDHRGDPADLYPACREWTRPGLLGSVVYLSQYDAGRPLSRVTLAEVLGHDLLALGLLVGVYSGLERELSTLFTEGSASAWLARRDGVVASEDLLRRALTLAGGDPKLKVEPERWAVAAVDLIRAGPPSHVVAQLVALGSGAKGPTAGSLRRAVDREGLVLRRVREVLQQLLLVANRRLSKGKPTVPKVAPSPTIAEPLSSSEFARPAWLDLLRPGDAGPLGSSEERTTDPPDPLPPS